MVQVVIENPIVEKFIQEECHNDIELFTQCLESSINRHDLTINRILNEPQDESEGVVKSIVTGYEEARKMKKGELPKTSLDDLLNDQ